MSNIDLGGVSNGGVRSSLWGVKSRLRDIVMSSVAGATLDLRFTSKTYYRYDKTLTASDYFGDYAPGFEFFGVHSRASSATDPNWDFVNGSEVGRLEEYGQDERRGFTEGASTNNTSNARLEGSVAGVVGSGGQMPTGLTNAQGPATVEVMGSGYENGWPYVELEYTTTGSAFPQLFFGVPASYTATAGQDWTTSIGLKLVSSSGGFVGLGVKMREFAAGVITNDTLGSAYVAADSLHRRFAHSATLTGGTTDNALGGLLIGFNAAGSARFRLYAPQFENSAFPTSPVLPPKDTPAVATRAADVVSEVTIDRASGATYNDEWDFTHAGLSGNLTEFLPNVPRVGRKGLLVEEATTNEIRNPRAEGAVAGVPGTLPTHWRAIGFGSGLACDIAGTGDGYVDVRVSGTAVGNRFPRLAFGAVGYIPSAPGDPWTLSADMQVLSGSTANMTMSLAVTETGIANRDLLLIHDDVDGRMRRMVGTLASADAAVTTVEPAINFGVLNGLTVDVTLRIRHPQFEKKTFATSVALPPKGTLAAATRAADLINFTDLNWLGSEHTFIAEFLLGGFSGSSIIFGIGDTFNDGIYVDASSGGTRIEASVRSGGATAASLTPGGQSDIAVGDSFRVALSSRNDEHIMSSAGHTQVSDTSGATLSSVARLKVGSSSWSAAYGNGFNGFIQRLTYKPYFTPASDLEALAA